MDALHGAPAGKVVLRLAFGVAGGRKVLEADKEKASIDLICRGG